MSFEEKDLLWESKAKEPIMIRVVNMSQIDFDRWATINEEKTLHFDFWLINGKRVEIKTRRYESAIKKKYFRNKDILIETLSCVERKTLGWIYTTIADYLAYAFVDNKWQIRRFYLFYFPVLKKWWMKEGRFKDYQKAFGKTYGVTELLYRTENETVPVKDIPYDCFLYHPDYGNLDYSTGYKID